MIEENVPNDLENIWQKYGLKESPYSTSPLRLSGVLSIEKVFCGRINEVNKLQKMITSSNSTRTLIVGRFGIGKTTFANYVRWILCLKNKENAKFITTTTEIKIQPNWDASQFLLSTLCAIYTSSIIFDWNSQGMKLKTLKEIEPYVTITRQTSYQGTIGGLGGGISSSITNPVAFSPEILEDLLIRICKEIVDNKKQLILQYNNLENIDPERLSGTFKAIKEYIQIEGLHTLFLGPPSIISSLESHAPVYSIFSPHIILEALTADDILEILKKRCKELASETGKYFSPYEENTVKELYLKLNNIRFTFKVLEDATITVESEAPCKITMNEIKAVQEKEKKEIMSNLKENQLKIISALSSKDKELIPKELSEITGIGPTNLTVPLRELESKGLIITLKSKDDQRVKKVKLSENSYLRLIFTSEKY